MPKVSLSTITSGYGTVDALNENFDAIEAAFDNTLSRDGDIPNQMSANLDMNGYNILNQGNPITVEGFNWEGPWLTATSYQVGDTVQETGSVYICVVAHTSGVFATDLAASRWQLVAQANLPTQTGNSGKYLTTNGTSASWDGIKYTPLGTGAVQRTVTSKVQETVSVKDFGAVGDGVTDDTAAIQAAITATQGSSGELLFTAGTYLVSTLTVTSSLQLIGRGPQSIIKQKTSTSGNIFSITGAGNNVMFDSLTFDGNHANQAAQSTNCTIHSTATGGATLADVFSLVVQNCEFRDSTYAAVRVQGDNSFTTREVAWIINNRFINGAAGVDNAGDDYIPRDVALDDAVEAWVENNIFESNTAPATFGRSAIVLAQTQTATERLTEVTIVANRINRRGCNVSQNLGAIDLYIWGANCTVRDNIIKNSTASAIKWKQNASRLHILNNKIDSQLVAGVALNGNNPTHGSANDGCIVEGNQIANWDGATTGVITLSGYWPSTNDYSLGIVCRNNQLIACSGYQIQIVNTKAATVEGNQIYPTSATIGINASVGNDGETRIRNNYIGACSNYAIYTANSNAATFDALVDGNTILNNANTYAAFIKARRVSFNGNFLAGCVNGVTFNTITDLEASGNLLRNFSGTIGLLIDGVTNVALFSNSTAGITNGVFYNAAVTSKRDAANTWNWVAATPSGGYYNVGDQLWNSAPTAGGMVGWVCITAGTPGGWKPFGQISV